jgi:hypothetical protein
LQKDSEFVAAAEATVSGNAWKIAVSGGLDALRGETRQASS